MTSLTAENALLEQLLSSRHVGICLIDQTGLQINLWSDDPELRNALIEHQNQRVRELENGPYCNGEPARQASPVAYPVREPVNCTVRPSAANDFYSPRPGQDDGSGGQAGDDASFAQGIATLNSRATTPFNQPPPFPGS